MDRENHIFQKSMQVKLCFRDIIYHVSVIQKAHDICINKSSSGCTNRKRLNCQVLKTKISFSLSAWLMHCSQLGGIQGPNLHGPTPLSIPGVFSVQSEDRERLQQIQTYPLTTLARVICSLQLIISLARTTHKTLRREMRWWEMQPLIEQPLPVGITPQRGAMIIKC